MTSEDVDAMIDVILGMDKSLESIGESLDIIAEKIEKLDRHMHPMQYPRRGG